ncbi:MAG: glutamine--tRNA ligase/YqeY domain fusion protein [Rhodocyclaceae bacterium]|nr:glutamine--tRNA ligase/YqeY domain fusion protein [Rhodocyclaceae bacterium]
MSNEPTAPHATNFIRNIIDADLAANAFADRKWCGRPGTAAEQKDAPPDTARIRTRFPPEPNGYLHYGHAKSVLLNFNLARDYGGICHLRFDDTNPEKEEQEFVDGIVDAVRWLGGQSAPDNPDAPIYFASDYFDWMYRFAEHLIEHGHAYVDSQSAEEMRANRGTLTEPGTPSPFRDRTVDENLRLFREMRDGLHAEGSHVLRAKIDMASPNINLRDPAIYRIKHAHHHRQGGKWHIYPMYAYAHPIEDALENITHSICTLEFEDQRPWYDWLLAKLAEVGELLKPLPKQIEFSRLNLTYIITSKRYLKQLVDQHHVEGWDDPRMPTIVGARRRGFAPEGFQLFAERIGVSKADSWIDLTVLEDCQREVMNDACLRRVAVLNPLKLEITNYDAAAAEMCLAPNHPQQPETGKREVPFSRELWIEREDFEETPPKGFFRLFPGNSVRLRYAYVIRCTGCEKDHAGNVIKVLAEYLPETKSGSAGADSVKVKGNIHWLSAKHAHAAEVRLFDRLFKAPHPGRNSDNFLDDLNPNSKTVISAYLEPSLLEVQPDDRFQFERHGYFVADRVESTAGRPVWNRAVTLKDSWAAQK